MTGLADQQNADKNHEHKGQKPMPGTGHLDQAFLVGDEIYLRLIEPGDNAAAMALRPSIFPRSPERTEKWIEDDLTKSERLAVYVVMRKNDDVIVGSITVEREGLVLSLDPHTRPLSGEQGEAWLAAALRLLIPFLCGEHAATMLNIVVRADRTTLIAALAHIGARLAARFRETYLVGGKRVDQLIYEYANRAWIHRLGDPLDVPLERSGAGTPRPVPAPVVLEGDPPRNAVVVGHRVYLRPIEKADAKVFARLSRQETEPRWANGRPLRSAFQFAHWTEGLQADNPPSWVRFAVCLRSTDEVIGSMGIDYLDLVHGTGESESEINVVEYRGAGFGSEAKHLLFEYAFNVLGLHSLQSFVIFPNTRSAAALRKQGYRETGRMHWWYSRHGDFGNFVAFDLLASDWRAMPREALDRQSGRGGSAR